MSSLAIRSKTWNSPLCVLLLCLKNQAGILLRQGCHLFHFILAQTFAQDSAYRLYIHNRQPFPGNFNYKRSFFGPYPGGQPKDLHFVHVLHRRQQPVRNVVISIFPIRLKHSSILSVHSSSTFSVVFPVSNRCHPSRQTGLPPACHHAAIGPFLVLQPVNVLMPQTVPHLTL